MRRAPPTVLLLTAIACNSAPEVVSVTLAPELPTTVDDLLVTIDAIDADEDELELAIRWSVDASPVADLDGETRVPASRTGKGETWTVAVSATDGELSTAEVQAQVTVANTPPTGTTVAISPTTPTATDALTCTPAGFDDADGDPEGWRLWWTVDGVDAGTEATLGAGTAAAGQVVVCTAIPTDGEADGEALTAEVTVANTPPVLRGLSLTPSEPTTLTDLVAVPDGAADVDGDTVTLGFVWTVAGVVQDPAGDTLSAEHFAKGDEVEVIATPNDGRSDGSPVRASVTIGNAAPVVTEVAIDPSAATTLDPLAVRWTADDPDDDMVIGQVEWTVDGRAAGTGESLAAGVARRGELVVATVTVSDGRLTDVGSAELTIDNAPPPAPGIAIEPGAEAIAGRDDLLCYVATDAIDPDGDRLTYTFTWEVDGTPWTGSTLRTTWPGDTIDRDELTGGETWTCSAVADDGLATSPAATADVDIVACTTSTVYIDATDSGCISYGSTRTVWADNRVRAYNDSSTYDIVGWLLFDLSSVDPDAEVLSASIDLFEEWGSVSGKPELVLVESSSTGWSRSSLTTTSVTKGGAISSGYTSFTLSGWNTFDLDVSAWDWASALSNGEATIGTDNVSFGYSFVYFHGPDTSGKKPELRLEVEVCE